MRNSHEEFYAPYSLDLYSTCRINNGINHENSAIPLFVVRQGNEAQGFYRGLKENETNYGTRNIGDGFFVKLITWEMFYEPTSDAIELLTRATSKPDDITESLMGGIINTYMYVNNDGITGPPLRLSKSLPDGPVDWKKTMYWKGSIPTDDNSAIKLNNLRFHLGVVVLAPWTPIWPIHFRVTLSGTAVPL
jgi:hypothetical protein